MKFFTLSLFFILSACNDTAPKFSELGSTNINNSDKIGFDQDFYEIDSPAESLTISGRCDPRHQYLEVSFDGATWSRSSVAISSSGSDHNCQDGNFSFNLNPVSSYITFDSGVSDNQIKSIYVRGNLGFTTTAVKSAQVGSGDFEAPSLAKFNTISDYDNPQIRLTQEATDNTAIGGYEYSTDNGVTWNPCVLNSNLCPVNNLALGEEKSLALRAFDTSGNRGPSSSKKIRKGQIGRGFDGNVIGVVKVDDDRYLVYGEFQTYEPEVARGLARFNLIDDGTTFTQEFDTTFKIGRGLNSAISISSTETQSIDFLDIDDNDNIYLAGDFNSYQNSNKFFTKLDYQGKRTDTSWGGTVNIAAKPDRMSLKDESVRFDWFGSTLRNSLRIKADGTLDADFNCGNSLLIKDLLQTPEGDIITLEGSSATSLSLVKRNSDCSSPSTILTQADVSLAEASVQPTSPLTSLISVDGRYYLAGHFNQYQATSKPNCLLEFDPISGSVINSNVSLLDEVFNFDSSSSSCISSATNFNNSFISFGKPGASKHYFLSNNTLSPYSSTVHVSTNIGTAIPRTVAETTNFLLTSKGGTNSIKTLQKSTRSMYNNTSSLAQMTRVNSLKVKNNKVYAAGSFFMSPNVSKKSPLIAIVDGNGNIIQKWESTLGSAVYNIKKIKESGDITHYSVVGNFTKIFNTDRNDFAVVMYNKLTKTFEIDQSYKNITTLASTSYYLLDSVTDPDGNIYIVGDVDSTISGVTSKHIYKIKSSDGMIDPLFKTVFNDKAKTILFHNGLIYTTGIFTNIVIDGVTTSCRFAVLNSSGELNQCIPNTESNSTGITIPMTIIGDYLYFISRGRTPKIFSYDINNPSSSVSCNLGSYRVGERTLVQANNKFYVSDLKTIKEYSIPSTGPVVICGTPTNTRVLITNDNSYTNLYISPVSNEAGDDTLFLTGNFVSGIDNVPKHGILKLNSDLSINTQSFGDEH